MMLRLPGDVPARPGLRGRRVRRRAQGGGGGGRPGRGRCDGHRRRDRPAQGRRPGGEASRLGDRDRGPARGEGRPRRVRRADGQSRRPRPRREADRARDGHPVRSHPDQRDAHPSRADDGDHPRIQARGRVHESGRGQGRRGRRRRVEAADPGHHVLPARPGVDGRQEQQAPARQRDDLLGGPARRGRPADRPVRRRPARLGLPPQGRELRSRDVQPLHPHHRRAQAGRPLALVLRARGAGAGEGEGGDGPLLRRRLGLDAQPRPGRAGDDAPDHRGGEGRPEARGAPPGRARQGDPQRVHLQGPGLRRGRGRQGRGRLRGQAGEGPEGRPVRGRRLPGHAQGAGPHEGAGAQDVGPGHPDRRHRRRGGPRRVLHGARDRDQATLAVPLHVRLRARERLHRIHPRSPRPRAGGVSDLDGPAQLRGARDRRGDRRRRPSSSSNACTENSAVCSRIAYARESVRSSPSPRGRRWPGRPDEGHAVRQHGADRPRAGGSTSAAGASPSSAPSGHLLPRGEGNDSPRSTSDRHHAQCVLRVAGGLVGVARPAGPGRARAGGGTGPGPAHAGRGARDAPPGGPRAEDRAGGRRAGRHQPGRDRLGRGGAGSSSPR